ncbi:MAG: hypothetical protein ACJAT6_000350 [Akkermansiaceae bacterium]
MPQKQDRLSGNVSLAESFKKPEIFLWLRMSADLIDLSPYFFPQLGVILMVWELVEFQNVDGDLII